MANVDSPSGLKPVRHYGGGVIRPNEYTIADGYNTNLFTGDPVILVGAGKTIAIGTAGGNIVGVFAGCSYTKASGEHVFSRYWPASTDTLGSSEATALVWDDPKILFKVQVVTDGTGITAAMVGQLADLVSGTGSTQTGQSAWELTAPAGSETQVRIMGLHSHPSNAYGEHADVDVLIGEHELAGNLAEV
jgi:hypothetical protein